MVLELKLKNATISSYPVFSNNVFWKSFFFFFLVMIVLHFSTCSSSQIGTPGWTGEVNEIAIIYFLENMNAGHNFAVKYWSITLVLQRGGKNPKICGSVTEWAQMGRFVACSPVFSPQGHGALDTIQAACWPGRVLRGDVVPAAQKHISPSRGQPMDSGNNSGATLVGFPY